MYGLTMLKEYLIEILEGRKKYDARSYSTNKRGTIALIDSRTLKIYGYADLVNVRQIPSEEFIRWHCTGKWSNVSFRVDQNKIYYARDFKNVRIEEKPFKIEGDKKTWMFITDRSNIFK